jgi:hypothetical protein
MAAVAEGDSVSGFAVLVFLPLLSFRRRFLDSNMGWINGWMDGWMDGWMGWNLHTLAT